MDDLQLLDRNARYRQRHPDRIRASAKRWKIKNPNYYREHARRHYRQKPIMHLLRVIRNRAKKKGLPFNLTIADIVVPEKCPVLGILLVPFGRGTNGKSFNYSTVDRIVPGLGYVKGNIRIISFRANRLKNNGTLDEFRKIVAYMERQC